MDPIPEPREPPDDWCRSALVYRRIARQILSMQRKQGDGSIPPDVQNASDNWMRWAHAAQVKHERDTGKRFD